jgi:phosphopantothenate-cysteine ligase
MTNQPTEQDVKRALRVVVAGGGTVAPIDEIRWITNGSTGSFAAGLSEACLNAGAEVWHIATPTAQLPFIRSSRLDLGAGDLAKERDRLEKLAQTWRDVRERLHIITLQSGTVEEYGMRLAETLENNSIDVAFLAMAVSDFEPERKSGKIDSNTAELLIRCKRAPKIIQFVRDWSPDLYLVGFKLTVGASRQELIAKAREACALNRADLTIANDLRTLQAGAHVVHLVEPGGDEETVGPATNLAELVIERVFRRVLARSTN